MTTKILTGNHLKYERSLRDQKGNSVVIGVGPPGCGKTQIACNVAIQSLMAKKISTIVITRPAVTVDEDLGFLPGKITDKMLPYMAPIFDAFRNHINADKLNALLKSGKIVVGALSFIRGTTYKDCVLIADEMQNSTEKQMKTLLTRAGDNCNMVLTGDLDQSDIRGLNGLQDLISRIDREFNVSDESVFQVVQFEEGDICVASSPRRSTSFTRLRSRSLLFDVLARLRTSGPSWAHGTTGRPTC